MNPRPTDCKANTLTTMPSHQFALQLNQFALLLEEGIDYKCLIVALLVKDFIEHDCKEKFCKAENYES